MEGGQVRLTSHLVAAVELLHWWTAVDCLKNLRRLKAVVSEAARGHLGGAL